MREAGQINAEALAAAHAIIRPGANHCRPECRGRRSTEEIWCLLAFQKLSGTLSLPGQHQRQRQRRAGARNSRIKRKLKEGDIVSVDCGTVYEGLCGRFGFHRRGGRDFPRGRRLLEVTEAALYLGIEQDGGGKPGW